MRRPLIAVLCLAAACTREPSAAPPRAEFLLSSADSTYWVASSGGHLNVRGAPILLARYDGRFYEIYTADDDFSYDDALLIGQRLYRRDIATGDSTLLFADTTVARMASAYARAHPDEEPLGPNDDGEANPSTSATVQLDVLGVYGPYVNYEYHIDVDLPGSRPWHATRRGVVDIRTGAPSTVADLFGADAARTLGTQGRRTYETTRDSILGERSAEDAAGRRRADALRRLQFDERSFSIASLDGKPAVEFDVPGRGEGSVGRVLELDPIAVPEAPWWRDAAASLPEATAEGGDRWTHGDYTVLAHYDTAGETARLSLADSARREWPIGTVLAPLRQITWLDVPPIADADRTALRRAFNAAASYDESARVARDARPLPTPPRATLIAYAPLKACEGKPARDLRAHDAGACQQHGSRVRRRHPVDDGQGRRDRRVSAQPRERRHGVDRPRRFSRADSPRRPGRHEGERQLRRTVVDGGGRPR